jgi:DNA-binding response OmpR family regulator
MNPMQAIHREKTRYEQTHDLLVEWRWTAKLSAGLRVLVVGCEPALVKYFCTFLGVCGCQKVDIAFSGADAFGKARAHPPDILIVMTLMPDVPGVEIGSRIAQDSSCGVLFVSAFDTKLIASMQRLQAQGCLCLELSLPFENSDLLMKLQLLASRGGSRIV